MHSQKSWVPRPPEPISRTCVWMQTGGRCGQRRVRARRNEVRELRAASLRFLPTGGLYLAGGVCTKLMPRLGEVRTVILIVVYCTAVCVRRLEDATCLFECCVTQYIAAEFAAEAVNADILRTIPVSLIDDSADVGLLGARVRARRMLAAGASEAASAL